MIINQINISYIPVEDRLLLRINTNTSEEFRFWLTRAVVIQILSALAQVEVQVMVHAVTADGPAEANKSAKHSEKMFGTAFKPAEIFPIGKIPILLSRFSIKHNKNGVTGLFDLANKMNMQINFQFQMAATFYKQICRTVTACGWNLPKPPVFRQFYPYYRAAESETIH